MSEYNSFENIVKTFNELKAQAKATGNVADYKIKIFACIIKIIVSKGNDYNDLF